MKYSLGEYQISLRAVFGLVTFACVVGGLARYLSAPSPIGGLSVLGMMLACVCLFVATFYRFMVQPRR